MKCSELTQREYELLRSLAENDMNITAVADAVYSHRNTVVYHLDKIKQKTGLDPRCFYDLAKLLGEDAGIHISYRERQFAYRAAIEKYGKQHQCNKFDEELGEFLKELGVFMAEYGRIRNGKGNLEAFAEELADLSIMLEQLRLIFGVHEEVCNQTDFKIQRLLLRIAGEDD